MCSYLTASLVLSVWLMVFVGTTEAQSYTGPGFELSIASYNLSIAAVEPHMNFSVLDDGLVFQVIFYGQPTYIQVVLSSTSTQTYRCAGTKYAIGVQAAVWSMEISYGDSFFAVFTNETVQVNSTPLGVITTALEQLSCMNSRTCTIAGYNGLATLKVNLVSTVIGPYVNLWYVAALSFPLSYPWTNVWSIAGVYTTVSSSFVSTDNNGTFIFWVNPAFGSQVNLNFVPTSTTSGGYPFECGSKEQWFLMPAFVFTFHLNFAANSFTISSSEYYSTAPPGQVATVNSTPITCPYNKVCPMKLPADGYNGAGESINVAVAIE